MATTPLLEESIDVRYPLFITASLLAATAVRADGLDGDRKAIQGTWTIMSAEMRAEKKADLVGGTFTFAGDRVTIRVKGKAAATEGAFKLDPEAKPKRLDITPTGKEKPLLGIYMLDGDTLTVCMADKPEEDRPAKFETKAERKVALLVLKRAKP